MDLAPSVVRKIILDEHMLIRTKLSAIEQLIDKKQDRALKNAVDEFLHFFLKHLSTEEKLLRPVLKSIDHWGEIRVERLNKDHLEQTQEIKRLNSLVSENKFAEYEAALKIFVQSIYKDMEHEEKDYLSADLLKDDFITSGNCG